MSTPLLEVRDLSVRHGSTTAADHVSVVLPEATVLGVLGPSGSGKSTLLRAIAGLEQLATGSVRCRGEDLDGVPTHRRGFALMFQDGQLFEHQSVARNVGYALRLRHLPRTAVRRRVAELLELVGLPGTGDRMPATLSGGERQRIALARALAVQPRLLLLDEPLSALDRGLREELAGQLREVLHASGTAAVMVTHDQEEAFAVADRMAVMREGRLVQEGTLEQVWAHPADGWTARFLGYPVVLEGAPARRLGDLVDPAARWRTVALRRSALRVEPDGPLEATVTAVRQTPDLTRLEVVVPQLGPEAGPMHGVATGTAVVRTGDRVRLGVDPARVAAVGGDADHPPYTGSS